MDKRISYSFITLSSDHYIDILFSLDICFRYSQGGVVPIKLESIAILLYFLKIVSGSSSSTGNGQATYSYYSQKNKKNDKSQEGSYKRMFLFRMANPTSSAQDQGKVVYVIENVGVNDRLWNREIL